MNLHIKAQSCLKRLNKFAITLTTATILISSLSLAGGPQLPGYYGQDFYRGYQSGTVHNQELLQILFKILSGGHVKHPGQLDEVYDNCAGKPSPCIVHTALGYEGARKLMFGEKMYLKQEGKQFSVKDVYCERVFTNNDFSSQNGIGPGQIPDGKILNTEHTWPQSRFTGRFPTELQKSDLHHLFPTDSEMNSHRSSLHFGEVKSPTEPLKCPIAKIGHSTINGEIVFEPPHDHKGRVARAILYFATRYQMKISDPEEVTLKKWNHDYPVDADEYQRNDTIEQAQGDRNPFIDFPDLADQIQDF